MEPIESKPSKVITRTNFKKKNALEEKFTMQRKSRPSFGTVKLDAFNPSLKKYSSLKFSPNDFINKEDIKMESDVKSDESSCEIDEEFSYSSAISVRQFSGKYFQNERFRPYMEDRIIFEDGIHKDGGVFAVFDGHGGQKAVDFVSENFLQSVRDELRITKDIEKAFRSMIEKIQNSLEVFVEDSQSEGCTASIIYIFKENDKKRALTLNIGDSPILLFSKKNLRKLYEEHNCNNKEEVSRVKSAGCTIIKKKMMGSLSLTRSLGDFEYHEVGLTAEPYIQIVDLELGDVLLVGSDGVFEKINEADIISVLEENDSAINIVKMMTDKALSAKSKDNLSLLALIV